MEGKGQVQEPECEQGAALINDPREVTLSRDAREIVCVQVCVGASIVETAHAKALGRGTPRVIEGWH